MQKKVGNLCGKQVAKPKKAFYSIKLHSSFGRCEKKTEKNRTPILCRMKSTSNGRKSTTTNKKKKTRQYSKRRHLSALITDLA